MKTKTERALRVVGNAGEVLADDATRRSTFSETAVLAIVEENQALREQIATLQGAQSVYALTEGGMAVVRQGEILAKLDQILAGQDRAAQALTALSLNQVTREEFAQLRSDHNNLSYRVPV